MSNLGSAIYRARQFFAKWPISACIAITNVASRPYVRTYVRTPCDALFNEGVNHADRPPRRLSLRLITDALPDGCVPRTRRNCASRRRETHASTGGRNGCIYILCFIPACNKVVRAAAARSLRHHDVRTRLSASQCNWASIKCVDVRPATPVYPPVRPSACHKDRRWRSVTRCSLVDDANVTNRRPFARRAATGAMSFFRRGRFARLLGGGPPATAGPAPPRPRRRRRRWRRSVAGRLLMTGPVQSYVGAGPLFK